MALRCFLFSSDEETAARIRQILSGLGVEAEFCPDAVVAVERITNQPFQIVIIDWDKQPEAGLLLTTARERKAADRPITLAIVSDDASVPKALQAGANSVLRKPIVAAQAKDTLTTARDLLKAKQGSAASGAAAGAATAFLPASLHPGKTHLRAGEFLQSSSVTPGGQFETESDVSSSPGQLPAPEIDPLQELESVAAPVAKTRTAEPPPPSNDGRGLEWYLKNRVATQPGAASPSSAARGNPELMGYDQTSYSPPAAEPEEAPAKPAPLPKSAPPVLPRPLPDLPGWREQKREAALFSYIESGSNPSETEPSPRLRLGKRAIVAALALAAVAVLAAPQAPWHSKMKSLLANGRQAMHVWLNPQPVTPPQAPAVHENFYRAGDEYKLPVAENIPDATTDPTQIRVLPAVDPTAKKPNNDASGADPTTLPATDQPQIAPPPDNPPQSPPVGAQPVTPSVSSVVVPLAAFPNPVPPAAARPSPAHAVTPPGSVPSSLKSQLASMTPDASGNKLPEAALPSIEPVNVPESAERALLTDQPAIAYPANVKGDQGMVVLQVLIGRDGTIQDAKFFQGSLAFARAAIDGVKLWKFKPYSMNGRPVSVQTLLTMKFKPAQ